MIIDERQITEDFDPERIRSLGDVDQGCFYCGAAVGEVFIEWHGHDHRLRGLSVIQLHPVCAVELCVRLLRDAHEYECQFKQSLGMGPI